jgi:RNA polymerase primary sigma factor
VARTVKQNDLCKTNLEKFVKCINKLKKSNNYTDDEITFIQTKLKENILRDVRLIKDCSEKNITEFYIETLTSKLDKSDIFNTDTFWSDLTERSRDKLAAKYTSNKTFDNNIDIYFNEVKAEYIRHPMGECNDLEFIPENYDIFIKNNLKTVIECAKRYQNLGLTFEDLIQAGNVGLLTALEKYDKNKANLRIKILKLLHSSEYETFTYEQAKELITNGFSYSKNLEQTINKLPQSGFNSKSSFEEWINKHIKVASFASVAFMWIRAQIIIELNQVGNIIHVPQSAQKQGVAMANIIHLDSINPHTEDCYHDNQISNVVNDEFIIEDEYLETTERNNMFKDIVHDVLYKLTDVERRIVKKRFSIDFPYQLSINEIAENEMLSVNKVKYILNNALKKIAANISPRDRESICQMIG